jgi:hypothetical protein
MKKAFGIFLLLLSAVAGVLLPGSASAKALPTSASQLDCGSLGRFDPRIEGFPTQVTSAREIPADGRDVCEVAGYTNLH